MRGKLFSMALGVLSTAAIGLSLLMAGCASQPGQSAPQSREPEMSQPEQASSQKQGSGPESQPEQPAPQGEEAGSATVLYMGQGSLRVVTAEGKVIYIDPFSGPGDWYQLPADLILVTHGHPDHNKIELIENRNEDCRIITHEEALEGGIHQTFDLGYVTVEAVEAGYNKNHDVKSCVGYILTFSNGRSVYACGDTSTTEQMPKLAEKEIDYAFFCCDGNFNMDTEEASACAELVGAKHSIPYHMAPGGENNFNREIAEQFQAEGRIILEPGEELLVE